MNRPLPEQPDGQASGDERHEDHEHHHHFVETAREVVSHRISGLPVSAVTTSEWALVRDAYPLTCHLLVGPQPALNKRTNMPGCSQSYSCRETTTVLSSLKVEARTRI